MALTWHKKKTRETKNENRKNQTSNKVCTRKRRLANDLENLYMWLCDCEYIEKQTAEKKEEI